MLSTLWKPGGMSVTLLQQMVSRGKPFNLSGLHFPSWCRLLQLYMKPRLLVPDTVLSALTSTLPQEDSTHSNTNQDLSLHLLYSPDL